jgi:hypothetical protein
MKVRINNIGAEPVTYIGKAPKVAEYECSIVKYYPNNFYGKLEKYLKDGWEDKGTFLLQKDGVSIEKELFKNKENYVVIAYLKFDPSKDYCTELKSFGDRLLLYINEDEEKDFFEVYKMVDRMLVKKSGKNKQNESKN